jgi:hypothetical protein
VRGPRCGTLGLMRVASLRLRFLAALVDAAVVLGPMAALVGLGIAGVVVYGRVRGDRGQDPQEGDEQAQPGGDGADEPVDLQRLTRGAAQPSWLHAALAGAGVGLAVAGRNWRDPGFRVLRLRRVDAHTGGTVRVRSALRGAWFDQVLQTAARQLFGSRARRERARISALGPPLGAVQRQYAADPQARHRAVMEFYKANEVTPFAGCGWQLAGTVVSQLVLALGTRKGRTVRDRLTGTSVILDR